MFSMITFVCQQLKGRLLMALGRDALNFLFFLLHRRGYL